MNTLRLILAACLLSLTVSAPGSNAAPSTPQAAPSIQIQCTLHSIHDEPPDLEATVKFAWRAANANHVLIKGFDDVRHPLTGSIDKVYGGKYTFIAVAGDRVARYVKKCVQRHRPGPGIHGLIWDVDEVPDPKDHFVDDSAVTVTTRLSKVEVQSRIAQLLSQKFGVSTVEQSSGTDNVYLTATQLGTHESLCERDRCRSGNVTLERKVGFDVWVEKLSQPPGGPSTYKIHLLTIVLARPAADNAEWNADPNAKIVGLPVTVLAVSEITRLFCCQ